MREKTFELQVRLFLTDDCKCWVLKTWSNGVQREGVPDLLVCCNGFFLGVEIKAERGRPSSLQEREIKKIRESYGIGIVLYPDQFDDFKELINKLIEGLHYGAWCDQKNFDREKKQ